MIQTVLASVHACSARVDRGARNVPKVGRVRTCKVGPHRLEEATAWLEKYRQLWAARFDELDGVIEDLKQREKFDGRNKKSE